MCCAVRAIICVALNQSLTLEDAFGNIAVEYGTCKQPLIKWMNERMVNMTVRGLLTAEIPRNSSVASTFRCQSYPSENQFPPLIISSTTFPFPRPPIHHCFLQCYISPKKIKKLYQWVRTDIRPNIRAKEWQSWENDSVPKGHLRRCYLRELDLPVNEILKLCTHLCKGPMRLSLRKLDRMFEKSGYICRLCNQWNWSLELDHRIRILLRRTNEWMNEWIKNIQNDSKKWHVSEPLNYHISLDIPSFRLERAGSW